MDACMRFCLPSPVPGSCDDMIAYAEGPVGNKLDRPGDLGLCFQEAGTSMMYSVHPAHARPTQAWTNAAAGCWRLPDCNHR
jgi:hypothetical protein